MGWVQVPGESAKNGMLSLQTTCHSSAEHRQEPCYRPQFSSCCVPVSRRDVGVEGGLPRDMYPLPQLVLLYLSRAGPQSKRTQTRGNPLASASEVLLSPVIQAPWNIYRVKSFRFSVAHTKAPPAARSPTDHGPSASALSHGVSESSSGS